ncbi:ankyrin repeat domain-containing protein [Neisseria wadsworthii]|uniref:Uncharacterized protein n=1 Tax=Neisseria wadsworthii 9715 TaxID=1030841 RepID=G4CQR1_9NEIS|nr:ankyrin repeat domain-containing protein [Neisseria wadsworthii]EGZ46163.1 hypothetical protein HMPREF9370_1421 [Neisseria wadsworthii 9715]
MLKYIPLLYLLSGIPETIADSGIPHFRYTDSRQCHVYTSPHTWGSLIHILVSEHSHPLFGLNQEQVLEKLEQAIQRGCSLKEKDLAELTPLQAAILFNDADMADFLLKHGANPYARIQFSNKSRKSNGKNSFEFLDLLIEAETKSSLPNPSFRNRSKLKQILQSYQ